MRRGRTLFWTIIGSVVAAVAVVIALIHVNSGTSPKAASSPVPPISASASPQASRVCPSGNSEDFQHVLVLISLRPAPFRGSRRAGKPGPGQDIRINLPQEHLVLL